MAVSPFKVKLLQRGIAFAVTEGREERGDTEIFKNTPCLATSVYSVFCAAGNGAGVNGAVAVWGQTPRPRGTALVS